MHRFSLAGLGEASVTAAAPVTSDEPKKLVFKTTLTALQKLDDLIQSIDKTYDFQWVGIAGKSTGDFAVNFKDATGRDIFSARASASLVIGTGQFPVEWDHAFFFPAGGKIGISLEDLSNAENTIELIFIGIAQYASN